MSDSPGGKVKTKWADMTLGEALDEGIESLQRHLDEMKKDRASISPDLLEMKQSELSRLRAVKK